MNYNCKFCSTKLKILSTYPDATSYICNNCVRIVTYSYDFKFKLLTINIIDTNKYDLFFNKKCILLNFNYNTTYSTIGYDYRSKNCIKLNTIYPATPESFEYDVEQIKKLSILK